MADFLTSVSMKQVLSTVYSLPSAAAKHSREVCPQKHSGEMYYDIPLFQQGLNCVMVNNLIAQSAKSKSMVMLLHGCIPRFKL